MSLDTSSNPLVQLVMESKWDSSWDPKLQRLVTECYFDFKLIAERMNQEFKTSAFTEQICQTRWGEIHKQRKNQALKKDNDKEKAEKLRQISAPPMEDPKKSMTLEELTQNLPKTRKKRDFLDPSPQEFDKTQDITFTGEKITPSGFNILKDRIRPSEEEQRKREQEFLKNLEKIVNEAEEIDAENPFIYKAIFQAEQKFRVERIGLDTKEAQERLNEKIDYRQLKALEKELEREDPSKQKEKIKENKENVKEEKENPKEIVVNVEKPKPASVNMEKVKETLEQIFEPKNKYLQMLEQGNIDDVFAELTKFEEKFNKTQKYEVLYRDEEKIEEIVLKEEKVTKPESHEETKLKEGDLILEKPQETYPQEREDETRKNLPEALINLEVHEIDDFDDEDEFLEQQRAKLTGKPIEEKPTTAKSTTKSQASTEASYIDKQYFKNHEEEVKLEGSQSTSEIQHRKEQIPATSNDKAGKIEPNRKTPMGPLKENIQKKIEKEENMILKPFEDAMKVLKTQPAKKKSEEAQPNPWEQVVDEDPEEAREREKRQKELDEQSKKLASLLKDLERRNEEFAKKMEEEEQKQKEEEQRRTIEETQNRKKLLENALKNAWTNSYVTSFFDDKISYYPHVSALPQKLTDYFNKKGGIEEREKLLHRYQMVCFPILADPAIFIGELLEYFLKFSAFNANLEEDDKNSNFHFQLISFGMFAKYDNKPKDSLQESIQNRKINDYAYLLFDTFEGRGAQILEDVIRTVQLIEIFTPDTLKKIHSSSLFKDSCATLQDIVVFLYKSLDMIDEVFNGDAAVTGICLEETEDPTPNDYEYSLILMSYVQKEKFTLEAKQAAVKKSNFISLKKKLVKQNLQIIGIKSVYLTKDDIEGFKSRIGYLAINDPQPMLAIAIGGYQAIDKVKNIVGSTELDIAKKQEPNSLNAKYGSIKGKKVVCPTNKNIAKKWMNFFFGGRIDEKNLLNADKKPHPINYSIITKPFKHIVTLVSSKLGNKNFPKLLRDLTDKGYYIKDVHMLTRNMMRHILEKSGPQLSDRFIWFSDKYNLECFKFLCSSTQNSCNYLISMTGPDAAVIKDFIYEKYFTKEDGDQEELVASFDDFDSLDLLDKLFFSKKIKYSNPDFTPGKNMKYYTFMAPLKSAHDTYNFTDDLAKLVNEGVELIGFDIMRPSLFKIVSEKVINWFKNSLRISPYAKQRKDFQRFLDKVIAYLEKNSLIVAILRQQNPLKSTNELSKLPVFANSNFYIPESAIYTYGSADSKTDVNSDLLEKLILECGLDDILEFSEKTHIPLGDDRSIKESFVYDLPPKIDGVSHTELVTTVLVVSQSTIKTASINFAIKFFEQAGFEITMFNLAYLSDDFINTVQYNLEISENFQEEKWPALKEKMTTEPFWIFNLRKYNAIFECKTMIYEFLKKIHVLEGKLLDKNLKEIELPYIYGLYCSKSYEDAERDIANVQLLYNNNKDLRTSLKLDQANKLVATDNNNLTAKSEAGVVIFRNKNLIGTNGLYELIDHFYSMKLKVINFKVLDQFSSEDVAVLMQIFGMKHDQDTLRAFFQTDGAKYFVIPIEYKLGTTLNDALGSFRFKANFEKAVFSKGPILQRYGCEFVYTSNLPEVSKLITRYFGVVDSQAFNLE